MEVPIMTAPSHGLFDMYEHMYMYMYIHVIILQCHVIQD